MLISPLPVFCSFNYKQQDDKKSKESELYFEYIKQIKKSMSYKCIEKGNGVGGSKKIAELYK